MSYEHKQWVLEKGQSEKNPNEPLRKAQTTYGWNPFVSILRIGCDLLRYYDFCAIVITQK